jgi:flavin reductase (DIM6/NTAB) family NADH-FMN oxidoreductase RutF
MTVTPLDQKLALDPKTLRAAFGAFPSGVVAVAAEVDGVLSAIAASSFTSVSLEPALVSFSVANTSGTWPLLRKAGHLGLSVLADHHDAVCRQLAGPAARRFDGLETTRTDEGAVLLTDAVATFDCTIHREIEAGDHTIVLLRLHAVDDVGLALPLVFHRSAFGRLAS